ncbi:hypothetical protein DL897_07785 [Thermoflavimicrobium daqui]|uniref:Prohead serine protease domain-containing protein n=1 Tax=Thermoflavimicrobium daqui TaxID=2137476 RepID=A0A364K6M1_9BACL|nr:hypothetical protein DL897_07785 [Thermoflavimicrobium daqui]
MKLEQRQSPISDLDIRTNNGKMQIGGYAARFHKLPMPLWGFREQIQPGAFSKSIQENNIKALWNHDSNYPLGSSKSGSLRLQ